MADPVDAPTAPDTEPCDCLCHTWRGDAGQGYSYVYDDDRGIRHEDWITCRCGCPKEPVRG